MRSKISTLGVIKIIIFVFLIFSFFPTFAATSTNYWDYDESSTVSDNLNNFAPNTLVWTDKATYDNLIQVLDEMQICSIGRYVIDKFVDGDKAKIDALKNGSAQ